MDRRIGWWLEKKVEGVQGKGMATGEGRGWDEWGLFCKRKISRVISQDHTQHC